MIGFPRAVRGRLRSDAAIESGTAVVEFVGLAVIVMVPIAYAVIVGVELHSASYAAVTAAREAGRAYVTAGSPASAAARARVAARMAMEDQGARVPDIQIRCLGGPCLAPQTRVHITVTTRVPLPLVPGDSPRGTISVTADHEAAIDTYRNSG